MAWRLNILLVGCLCLACAAPAAPAESHPYIQPTAEQSLAAITAAEQQAREIARKLHLRLREIQTDHCLIFTDWDQRESDFLEVNLEGAYAAVSRQFNLSPQRNIFVGKLPVYMLADQKEFVAFAHEVDHFEAGKGVAGYYWGRTDGIGHLVMWKPKIESNDRQAAMRDWGYVLAHEFTHAFVARYRTNAIIPTWLNEGLAEVVASSVFPRPRAIEQAREMAAAHPSIATIFHMARPAGQWYPVMQTLVQTLLTRSRPQFLKMFDDIKEGMSDQQALKACYGWSYADLEQAWRAYLSR